MIFYILRDLVIFQHIIFYVRKSDKFTAERT